MPIRKAGDFLPGKQERAKGSADIAAIKLQYSSTRFRPRALAW